MEPQAEDCGDAMGNTGAGSDYRILNGSVTTPQSAHAENTYRRRESRIPQIHPARFGG
jgi:hypothetical protein